MKLITEERFSDLVDRVEELECTDYVDNSIADFGEDIARIKIFCACVTACAFTGAAAALVGSFL